MATLSDIRRWDRGFDHHHTVSLHPPLPARPSAVALSHQSHRAAAGCWSPAHAKCSASRTRRFTRRPSGVVCGMTTRSPRQSRAACGQRPGPAEPTPSYGASASGMPRWCRYAAPRLPGSLPPRGTAAVPAAGGLQAAGRLPASPHASVRGPDRARLDAVQGVVLPGAAVAAARGSVSISGGKRQGKVA